MGRILPRGPWGLSLVLSLAVPYISVGLETGSVTHAFSRAGPITHNPPAGLGSDFISHSPLHCCSLARSPTVPFLLVWNLASLRISSKLAIRHLWCPLQAWKPHYPQSQEARV